MDVDKPKIDFLGILGILTGVVLGATLGFASSQYFPFFGADGFGSMAEPFSQYRMQLIPQHVIVGMVLGLGAAVAIRRMRPG